MLKVSIKGKNFKILGHISYCRGMLDYEDYFLENKSTLRINANTLISCIIDGESKSYIKLWEIYQDSKDYREQKIRMAYRYFRQFLDPREAWYEADKMVRYVKG